jgi:dTDP-4-dehydrorhamnose reductase
MRVAVLGANGQLGADVCAAYRCVGAEVTELDHTAVDVADDDAVRAVLRAARPDVIVNTAAMHSIDACEVDPARADAVNAEGPEHLAHVSSELQCVLIHISTDYVFGGESRTPYAETDEARPVNVYGRTKLRGEAFVQANAPKHFVVRTSALFGEAPCRAKQGLNFPKMMLKLARERGRVRVTDAERVSPTYTLDVANALVELAATQRYGLYHMVSRGSCTWFEFATRIFELTGTTVEIERAAPGEFAGKVSRPAFSVLDTSRLAGLGIVMPTWDDALARYLRTL